MTLKSLFDKTFNKDGGLFDTDSLDPFNRDQIYNFHRSIIEDNIWSVLKKSSIKAPTIYFDYIDNPLLGACAYHSKEDDIAFIGITYGSIVIVYQYFLQMLSYKHLFPNIGDPSLEVISEPTVRDEFINAMELKLEGGPFGRKFEANYPRDPIRAQYARLLALHAINFMAYHEIAHILNGHIHLKSTLGMTSFISDVSNDVSEKLPVFTRQVLEWDADCWATVRGIDSTVSAIQDISRVHESIRYVYSSFDNAHSTWLFSVSSLFHLWFHEKYDDNQLENMVHLPASFRLSYIPSTILARLEQKEDKTYLEAFDKIHYGALVFKDCEVAYSLLTGKPVSFDKIKKPFSPFAVLHLNRLIEEWKSIRPLLEPLAYVKLAD